MNLEPHLSCCAIYGNATPPSPQTGSGTGSGPLSGEWRANEGYLCCGTLRVAHIDFDTDPSPEFCREVFEWIASTLNNSAALTATKEALEEVEEKASKRIELAVDEALKLRAVLEEERRHIFLAAGYHARTEREVEIEQALNETRPEDRDSADNTIAELLELVDAGRSRYFAERDAKEVAEHALSAARAELEGLKAKLENRQKRLDEARAGRDRVSTALEAAGKERDEARGQRESTRQWCAERWEPLKQWARTDLPEELREQFFNIVANAAKTVTERPPTLTIQLNLMRHERDALTAQLAELRADGERLDWLMRNISGKALREIGVTTDGSRGFRAAIDTAISAAAKLEGEGE